MMATMKYIHSGLINSELILDFILPPENILFLHFMDCRSIHTFKCDRRQFLIGTATHFNIRQSGLLSLILF
jgi:hypothetical protein